MVFPVVVTEHWLDRVGGGRWEGGSRGRGIYVHLWLIQVGVGESEVAQSCLTLCYPVEYSPPGFSVHGIFQARILEWVAISFSRGSSQPRDWTQVSRIAGRCFNRWATREAQNLPAMQETEAWSLGQEDNLDNGILQYSSLENSTDRGAWQVTVHRVAKSQTCLRNYHFHFLMAEINAIL